VEAPRTRIVIDAYLKQKGQCPYCQNEVTKHNATWEHILPRAWGGPNIGLNIILACEPCNNAKSAIESLISNSFGTELDMGSRAALFILRCMKLNRGRRKAKLPPGTYLRMAEHMQFTADDWIQNGRVTIPELTDQTRGAFI
jgi:hypothetical protein